jgi:hypothetical protein
MKKRITINCGVLMCTPVCVRVHMCAGVSVCASMISFMCVCTIDTTFVCNDVEVRAEMFNIVSHTWVKGVNRGQRGEYGAEG